MPTLLELQDTFAGLVSQLIAHARTAGYKVTLGEAWRSDETARLMEWEGKGISNSLHRKRLAQDLNLFKDDVYLTDSKSYEPLGIFWEGLHPQARWGGRFTKPDGNHFSIEYEGVR